jgi:hypothetical protein
MLHSNAGEHKFESQKETRFFTMDPVLVVTRIELASCYVAPRFLESLCTAVLTIVGSQVSSKVAVNTTSAVPRLRFKM